MTDASGAYAVRGLAADDYNVCAFTASTPGPAVCFGGGALDDPAPPVHVALGHTTSGIDIALPNG